jgi:hypothetical protein
MTEKPNTLDLIKAATMAVPHSEGGSALSAALLKAAQERDLAKNFEEHEHPRDGDGKFASKSGGASGKAKKDDDLFNQSLDEGYDKLSGTIKEIEDGRKAQKALLDQIEQYASFKPKAVFSLMPEKKGPRMKERWKEATSDIGWFGGHGKRVNAAVKLFNEDATKMNDHLNSLVKQGAISYAEKNLTLSDFQKNAISTIQYGAMTDRWDKFIENHDEMHDGAVGFTGPKGESGIVWLVPVKKSDAGDLYKAHINTHQEAAMKKAAARYETNEKYGRIDTSYRNQKPGAMTSIAGALDHSQGGPVGMYMGAKHANRAAKFRGTIGGSPTKTPKDLKGRVWRNIGALTGGGLGAAAGHVVGGAGGAALGGLMGGKSGAAVGYKLASQAGSMVGGLMGAVGAHRRVRDSQLYARDYANKADAVEPNLDALAETLNKMDAFDRTDALIKMQRYVHDIMEKSDDLATMSDDELDEIAITWVGEDEMRKAAWATVAPALGAKVDALRALSEPEATEEVVEKAEKPAKKLKKAAPKVEPQAEDLEKGLMSGIAARAGAARNFVRGAPGRIAGAYRAAEGRAANMGANAMTAATRPGREFIGKMNEAMGRGPRKMGTANGRAQQRWNSTDSQIRRDAVKTGEKYGRYAFRGAVGGAGVAGVAGGAMALRNRKRDA